MINQQTAAKWQPLIDALKDGGVIQLNNGRQWRDVKEITGQRDFTKYRLSPPRIDLEKSDVNLGATIRPADNNPEEEVFTVLSVSKRGVRVASGFLTWGTLRQHWEWQREWDDCTRGGQWFPMSKTADDSASNPAED